MSTSVFNKYKIFYRLFLNKDGSAEIFKHENIDVVRGYALAYCNIYKTKSIFFQTVEILVSDSVIKEINELIVV